MKHYEIDEWVDLSRGLITGADRTLMQGHVEAGCRECRQLSDFTEELTATCARMAKDPVPEQAVQLARAVFTARAQGRPESGNRLPVELIFDSFLVPFPVGLRATWQVGWQGMFRAGDCSVDLRIEPELKSSRAAVVGQVTNLALPQQGMGDLPVSLRAGKQVVAETRSNRFGEFQMEYNQQAHLRLCIDLQDSKTIQVPLKRFVSEKPGIKSGKLSRTRTAEK